LESERLSINTKLNLYKALIKPLITCACPHGVRGGQISFEIVASAKQNSLRHWYFTKAHIDRRFTCGVQYSILVRFCYKTMQAAGSWQQRYRIMKM